MAQTDRMNRVRSVPSRAWQLASSACAFTAALALLFLPYGSSQSTFTDGAGNVRESAISHTTLLQTEGRSILFILAVPVLLTLIGLLSPTRARLTASTVSTSLLGVGVLLGMMSIGAFFVSALVCSIVAIVRTQSLSPAPTPTSDTVTA